MKNITILVCLLLLTACEKVVNIDLNESEPKLVIEGNVTNEHEPYIVKLSKTSNYTAINESPSVSDAKVKIWDNAGNSEILIETAPGIYTTKTIVGVPGRTYYLSVEAEGEQYFSSSYMPYFVKIDELKQDVITQLGETKIVIQTWFTDPATTQDYYRFSLDINHKPVSSIFTFDARLFDGLHLKYDLKQEEEEMEEAVKKDDTLDITLYHIDPKVYLYFLTLEQNSGDGPPTAPGNPVSNISNGALGYFSAHSVSHSRIIIK